MTIYLVSWHEAGSLCTEAFGRAIDRGQFIAQELLGRQYTLTTCEVK